MTLYIDLDTGEVYDDPERGGDIIGTVDDPSYTIPDDVKDVVRDTFPSDHSSVSVNDLHRTLDVADNDVEFGTPPE